MTSKHDSSVGSIVETVVVVEGGSLTPVFAPEIKAIVFLVVDMVVLFTCTLK